MGSFQRSGTFQDRPKFLDALKGKLGKLRSGTLAGMKEEWTHEGKTDVGTLSGFGVKIKLTVGDGAWDCAADIPLWIPIPQSKIEHIFDKEFEDLKGL